jgi:hypothetical protein
MKIARVYGVHHGYRKRIHALWRIIAVIAWLSAVTMLMRLVAVKITSIFLKLL